MNATRKADGTPYARVCSSPDRETPELDESSCRLLRNAAPSILRHAIHAGLVVAATLACNALAAAQDPLPIEDTTPQPPSPAEEPQPEFLDRDDIWNAMRDNEAVIAACFEPLQAVDEADDRYVRIHFDVSPDGDPTVTSLTFRDDATEEQAAALDDVEACVAVVIETWRFPPTESRRTLPVNFPFPYTRLESE